MYPGFGSLQRQLDFIQFAIGWLDAKLHTLIFKFEPAALRAIGLRKSTKEERKLYAENQ